MAAGDPSFQWQSPEFAGQNQSETCDVAVIGAGIGGLTAAVLCAKKGLSVRVFEQHSVVGGFAHNWSRRARDKETGERLLFRFDSGIHDVSGTFEGGPVDAILKDIGVDGNIRWVPTYRRCTILGKTINMPRSWPEYVAMLSNLFADETDEIEAFCAAVKAIHAAMYETGNQNGIPGRPENAQEIARFASSFPLAARWMRRPWPAFLNHFGLSATVTKWINELASYTSDQPENQSVGRMIPLFGYYMHGGAYPVGGSGKLSETLLDALRTAGGRVEVNTSVTKINIRDNSCSSIEIRTRSGAVETIKTRSVIANSDILSLFSSLIDDPMQNWKRLEESGRIQPSCSAFGLYLGLRGNLQLPPIVTHESEKGSLHLVSPSVMDASCAPPGYATLECTSLISFEEASRWFPELPTQKSLIAYRRSEKYKTAKAMQVERILKIAEDLVPDLRKRVVFQCASSPITYHRYAMTEKGAIYGNTIEGKALPNKLPIRGLVLAGSSTHGPGVEAVMISGAQAASALVSNIRFQS
ncbi:phytoene desaturase family protein [Shimia isoporae]|nr:NAD(P)/FAD-dependent oxidoreductase [Shimia isoporae]